MSRETYTAIASNIQEREGEGIIQRSDLLHIKKALRNSKTPAELAALIVTGGAGGLYGDHKWSALSLAEKHEIDADDTLTQALCKTIENSVRKDENSKHYVSVKALEQNLPTFLEHAEKTLAASKGRGM